MSGNGNDSHPDMSRRKLERYRQNSESDRVFEYSDFQDGTAEPPKGRWSEIFGRTAPLTLELACGRGEYSVSLAESNPDKDFVGVDIKGSRLWVGSRHADEKGLSNIRFLRIYIEQLSTYFSESEVDEIWVTFPDPYPKKRLEKKRLTSPRFLAMYEDILKPEGTVHLKTDARQLFDYTRLMAEKRNWELLSETDNLDSEPWVEELHRIETRFEKKHRARGSSIKYLRMRPRCN